MMFQDVWKALKYVSADTLNDHSNEDDYDMLIREVVNALAVVAV